MRGIKENYGAIKKQQECQKKYFECGLSSLYKYCVIT